METPRSGPPTISYSLEPELSVDEFVALLQKTSLGVRRPLANRDRVATMLTNATLIVTARIAGQLVGVSRALTDFAYCTYLSDLAVAEDFQGHGIGRELIARTHAAAGLQTMLILLAAPAAATYYPHIGMTQHESCWFRPRTEAP